MKNILLSSACFAIVFMTASKSTNGNDQVAEKILELFPQADINGDGELSSAEEATVSRMAMKRYPRADMDGDGVLSDSEKMKLLRQAAARSTRNAGSGLPSPKMSKNATTKPHPSHSNVKYGPHERNVFDIWLSETNSPAPLAIYIHGGGFKSGSKEKLSDKELSELLNEGISVAAINYRYVTSAPLPASHHDAKQALQFIRSKADEWNIDKNRVAAFGGSAGAQICMWLAFSDDMANPESDDPIERESTRLTCVATKGGQTANVLDFWRNRIGKLIGNNESLESLAKSFEDASDAEEAFMATWGASTPEEADKIAESCSALSLVSSDDPPIFMSYGMSPTAKVPDDPKRVRGWVVHHVLFGIALKEKTDALEVEADLRFPGSKSQYESTVDFFVDKLIKN